MYVEQLNIHRGFFSNVQLIQHDTPRLGSDFTTGGINNSAPGDHHFRGKRHGNSPPHRFLQGGRESAWETQQQRRYDMVHIRLIMGVYPIDRYG